LDSFCQSGDNEVTGHKTGMAVAMNYTSSRVYKEAAKTYLDLDFLIPNMYFVSPQDVNGISYDRSWAITFHDRERSPEVQNACWSLRQQSGNEHCSDANGGKAETWSWETNFLDSCLQQVTAKLPWDEMMRSDYHDADRVAIMTSSRTINGFDTPTWEVYMVASIETWVGFEEVSTTVSGAIPGQLTINQERYSYYEIPFRISFPKQITLVAPPIRIAAPLVTLYAVIEQEIIDINFNPQDGENFGQVQLVIKTQTQYPFGLRNFTDPVAPALIRTISGDINGDPQWISSQNPETCTNVDGSEGNNLCEQEWTILITPNLCDVSGNYQMEMWAICFTDVDGCALDDNAPSTGSNTWTGLMDFSVQAQNFCPQIVDEITVQGAIGKWSDNTYTTEAVPGSNVFSNDHVWFEVTYVTKSAKSQLTFAEGDDSLIEFVRPYSIKMGVSMNTEPLQFAVERSNNDVTGDTLNYVVQLCTATPAVYPYTSVADDCFSNLGWNAANYLDFAEHENNVGSNTIDANEIGFQLRLDERVIPVDLPNDQAVITLMVDSEVYYHGNNNPTRRRLTYNVDARRWMQEEGDAAPLRQNQRLTDSFAVTRRNQLTWCNMDSERDTAVFSLDVSMDSLVAPDPTNVLTHVADMKYSLGNSFNAMDKIEILSVSSCNSEACTQMWDVNGNVQNPSGETEFVRYLLIADGMDVAQDIQDQFYNNGAVYSSEFFQGKVVRDMSCDHCSEDIEAPEFTFEQIDSRRPQIDEASASTLALGFVSMMVLALF